MELALLTVEILASNLHIYKQDVNAVEDLSTTAK